MTIDLYARSYLTYYTIYESHKGHLMELSYVYVINVIMFIMARSLLCIKYTGWLRVIELTVYPMRKLSTSYLIEL